MSETAEALNTAKPFAAEGVEKLDDKGELTVKALLEREKIDEDSKKFGGGDEDTGHRLACTASCLTGSTTPRQDARGGSRWRDSDHDAGQGPQASRTQRYGECGLEFTLGMCQTGRPAA